MDRSINWIEGFINESFTTLRSMAIGNFSLRPEAMEERLALPRGWHEDGVIARVSTQNMAHELSGLGIPVVNVSGIQLQGVDFPKVTSDLVAWARIAADHFLARGFRSFAYFSLHGLEYVAAHQQAPRAPYLPWPR